MKDKELESERNQIILQENGLLMKDKEIEILKLQLQLSNNQLKNNDQNGIDNTRKINKRKNGLAIYSR